MLSDEIDDANSLLEIQRFNLAKIESRKEDHEINFISEPRKSKK